MTWSVGAWAALCAAAIGAAWMTSGTVSAQSPPAAPGQAPAQAQGAPGPAGPRPVSTEAGFGLFQQRCLACHGNPAYERAPSPAALREMTPEHIYDTLTNGVMKSIGDTLTDAERRMVSESIAGRLMGAAASIDAKAMPNRCKANPAFNLSAAKGWNGWGVDLQNTRFQPAPGLSASDLPKLKLKWSFGLPTSTSSYSQPTAMGGRVFVGADSGAVYSLDAATGCVFWSFTAKAGVRNALVIGPGPSGPAVYFGDLKANVYALDARTGRQLWTNRIEEHYTNRVTAAPALYKGRLYVPLSSWEEFNARSLDYACCTSVGAVAAVDAATGKLLWKTYVIPERPQPTRKNEKGVQQYGPAGGSVWNTPTVDPERNAIYFGTGDATTFPAATTSDSVMALDMASGRMLWTHQVHKNDSFLVGCNGAGRTDNCPQVQGPDWDIPAAVILKKLGDGRRLLVVGTKPGDILGLDPDRQGQLVWRVNVNGGALAGDGPLPAGTRPSGVQWGGAADDKAVYYGLTGGGMAAIRLADGERLWRTPLNSTPGGPRLSNGAPASAIPGAIVVGGSDGRVTAVSMADGGAIWSTETARPFDTVNKVQAKGGSIVSIGPTFADGMMFIGSGYAVAGGQPGNVLLAYAAR